MANAASEAALRAPLLMPWLAYLQAEAGELRAAGDALRSLPTRIWPHIRARVRECCRALVAGRLGNVSGCASEVDGIATTEECRGFARFDSCSARRENARGLEHGALAAWTLQSKRCRAGRSRFLVWALAEAVTGAWFAGDEHARLAYAEALREAVLQYDAGGLVYFGGNAVKRTKADRERSRLVGWHWLI